MKTMILCFDGLEECEALLTYDLLFRAKINVRLIGIKKEIISSHNITFNNHELIDDINLDEYECLILPGGLPGTINLEENDKVQNIIDYFMSHNKLICAICAAPSILINKGLLKDYEFTCYPGFEKEHLSTKEKVHIHNNIITARGLGAAYQFGYEIIKKLKNQEIADNVLKTIQY